MVVTLRNVWIAVLLRTRVKSWISVVYLLYLRALLKRRPVWRRWENATVRTRHAIFVSQIIGNASRRLVQLFHELHLLLRTLVWTLHACPRLKPCKKWFSIIVIVLFFSRNLNYRRRMPFLHHLSFLLCWIYLHLFKEWSWRFSGHKGPFHIVVLNRAHHALEDIVIRELFHTLCNQVLFHIFNLLELLLNLELEKLVVVGDGWEVLLKRRSILLHHLVPTIHLRVTLFRRSLGTFLLFKLLLQLRIYSVTSVSISREVRVWYLIAKVTGWLHD